MIVVKLADEIYELLDWEPPTPGKLHEADPTNEGQFWSERLSDNPTSDGPRGTIKPGTAVR